MTVIEDSITYRLNDIQQLEKDLQSGKAIKKKFTDYYGKEWFEWEIHDWYLDYIVRWG